MTAATTTHAPQTSRRNARRIQDSHLIRLAEAIRDAPGHTLKHHARRMKVHSGTIRRWVQALERGGVRFVIDSHGHMAYAGGLDDFIARKDTSGPGNGLTISHYMDLIDLLNAIRAEPDQRASHYAAQLGTTGAAVERSLQTLERHGVHISRDSDGRLRYRDGWRAFRNWALEHVQDDHDAVYFAANCRMLYASVLADAAMELHGDERLHWFDSALAAHMAELIGIPPEYLQQQARRMSRRSPETTEELYQQWQESGLNLTTWERQRGFTVGNIRSRFRAAGLDTGPALQPRHAFSPEQLAEYHQQFLASGLTIYQFEKQLGMSQNLLRSRFLKAGLEVPRPAVVARPRQRLC